MPYRPLLRLAALLAAAWVLIAGTLILCGEGIKHSGAVNAADRRITSFVVGHRTPALDDLMKVVTWAGSWVAVLVVAAAVAGLAWRRWLPPLAVAGVGVAWAGEWLAATISKDVVDRWRPPPALHLVVARGWSFPSGHAANAVVVFGAAAWVLALRLRSTPVCALVWSVAALLVALVGFSRVELGVHWTTDVLCGAVWSMLWAGAVVAFLGSGPPAGSFRVPPRRAPDAELDRRRRQSPVPGAGGHDRRVAGPGLLALGWLWFVPRRPGWRPGRRPGLP